MPLFPSFSIKQTKTTKTTKTTQIKASNFKDLFFEMKDNLLE
jgi:hypothetical protein